MIAMQTPVPVYTITDPVMGEVSWSGVRPMPSPRTVTPAGIVSVPVVRYIPGGLRAAQARPRPRGCVDVRGPAWRKTEREEWLDWQLLLVKLGAVQVRSGKVVQGA